MEKLKPKLFSVMKSYTKEQFIKDVIAGVIVAIIALPLSIALALASGVTPEKGIYTAIIAGFIGAFLGGSRVQITGPTAAFATIVAGIVARNGMEGLVVATVIAGILLILMGFLRFGSLIKFIPFTITTGFTSGIALTILIGQLKDFFGLKIVSATPIIETIEKLRADFFALSTINLQATAVGIVSILILLLWPKVNKKIPPSLIAVIVGILLVKFLDLKVNTIGDLYEISNKLPAFHVPGITFATVKNVIPDAITIAVLAAVESLLSCVVSDSMVNSKHRSNMELIAQGAANLGSALFGGIPATGAIARTAANVKNGGRTPIAGMVHSVTLLLVLVLLMPYAALIPMPTIAAILFVVAYNMCEWREFAYLCKTSPKSDIIVLVTTFALTVVFDLVMAIAIGLIMAALLFMKRMSEVTEIEGWKYIDDEEDPDSITLRQVPDKTLVYEISGPLFFGAADKLLDITITDKQKNMILRMRSVTAIDATAMHTLEKLYERCKRKKINLILSHVNDQPRVIMEKAGFIDKIGRGNLCTHIDDAIKRAQDLQ